MRDRLPLGGQVRPAAAGDPPADRTQLSPPRRRPRLPAADFHAFPTPGAAAHAGTGAGATAPIAPGEAAAVAPAAAARDGRDGAGGAAAGGLADPARGHPG